MKSLKCRGMSQFVKVGILLVIHLKRKKKKRKRKKERKRGYVLCSLPSHFETACSWKLAESAPHSSVEDYNHSNTWSVQQRRDKSNLARCCMKFLCLVLN